MNTLKAMLQAYLANSMSTEEFTEQFISFWNEIRVEQNKAIESSGIRSELDALWSDYKAGNLDEVTYGMRWTEALNKLENVRIMPQSIVASLGNDVYNYLTLYSESEHIDTQEVPTEAIIRETSQNLLESIIS